MTNENQLAKIISFTREIETILKNKFQAQGKGLHTYLDSIESKLDSGLVKNLRYVATIRNKSMHESNFTVDDFHRYEKVAKESIFALKNTTIQSLRNTRGRPIVRSNRGNTFVKILRNILLIVTLFLLLINAKVISLWISEIFASPSNNVKQEVQISEQNILDINGDIIDSAYRPAIKKEEKNVIYISPKPKNSYRCTGKQYCSQMSSCAEATFYIQNCPNTRMDGDGDGIPCRRQWCH